MNSSTVTVPGYWCNIALTGRAVQLKQTTNADGHVQSSSYNSGTALTTITVDCTVDTGLTELWFGQDPANAPLIAMAGATTSTDGKSGITPLPKAGQQNSSLYGDGKYRDPCIDGQIWS